MICSFKRCLALMTYLFIAGTLDVYSSDVRSTEPDLSFYMIEQKSPPARIKQFQKEFKDALKDPFQIRKLGKVYTDGLRIDIGYTDSGPSFVAFVDLHQALYRYIERKDAHDLPVPSEVSKAFREASNKFISQVSELDSLKDIESYEDKLNRLYKGFLVRFMKNHQDFFKVHFFQTLKKSAGFQGYEMTIIDCAFFALQEGWPGYESNDRKYQFEQLYAYHCRDGRVLILGYPNRQYSCDGNLRVYILKIDTLNNIPKKIIHGNMDFDLSPVLRFGGCSYRAHVPEVINFDGNILRFYGYDYSVFRYYIYEVTANVWQITEIPSLIL